MSITKVIILAAGRGTRMRQGDSKTCLSRDQMTAASGGVKALIPIDRPFLDYVLARTADAGYRQVCLVIGPHHDELRQYYSNVATERLTIQFAVQHQPLGTAHALLAAVDFVGKDPFLVLNSDNYYPTGALRDLRQAEGHAMIGYEREALVAKSNIPRDRVARFAIVDQDRHGNLCRIVEKPTPEFVEQMPQPVLVSMNSWRFESEILAACRAIDRSSRGEYEIPDAVTHTMSGSGARVKVIRSAEPVLDLSNQQDIATVAEHLQGVAVRL